ncbi:hypothetical protein ACNTMW_12825 [Planosporangium sp. 12N6]|uniref:hypothetical protein n=1 Tax=Planosporangium spinosum TaxID=3402278 RepID=UPI003CEF357C
MTTPPPPPGTSARPDAPAPTVTSRPGTTAPVYLVAGGDMVAVFDTRDAADIMATTMTGANLEPITARLSAVEWDEVRARLLARVPGVTITDTRPGRAGGTR